MIDSFLNYNGEDKVISSHDAKEYFKPKRAYNVLTTGFKALDYIIQGFREGDLITITGLTGHGKTSFCRELTYKFEDRKSYSLWFSCEEIPHLFLQKFPNLPLFYLPQKIVSMNLAWIEDRIKEAKSKYETRVIFIDHLHYLIPLKQSINASLLIGGIVRELKQMALRNHVITFLVAHPSKIPEGCTFGIQHIRDSGLISQESDKVLCVQRKSVKNDDGDMDFCNEAKIRVWKDRLTGFTGTCKLIYKNNRFYEIDSIL